jgi:hypothetical protein
MKSRTQFRWERFADYKSEWPAMSKKFRLILPLVGAFGLLSASLFAASLAAATGTQGAGAAAGAARNAAIVATTQAVLRETSEVRQLTILRPVKSGAQSRSEIERMVIRNLDEQTTPADMHATEVALRKLGLVPQGFEYRSFVVKLLTEQVAGYYDPKAQQFYLADWLELEGQKPVMAHELTHALQDQHFNLRRFEQWPKGDADSELAAHALIEGDATLAMTLYMAKNPLVALAFIRSVASTQTSSEQIQKAPRALRESLVFPYQEGSEWATQVYKRGGWSLVSEAYKQLPQSTEQILHPEKYFVREAPVKVTLPELRPVLGQNWKRLDADVNGEWSYYLILDEFLKDSIESRRAAAGWAGDRYALYQGSGPGQVLLGQLTVWDSENDAREFFDAYAKRTLRRYPDARAIDTVSGRPSAAAASHMQNASGQMLPNERRTWHTSEGGVVLELRGTRVVILEGIPSGGNGEGLLRIVWQ